MERTFKGLLRQKQYDHTAGSALLFRPLPGNLFQAVISAFCSDRLRFIKKNDRPIHFHKSNLSLGLMFLR